jgi:hypothetical protein
MVLRGFCFELLALSRDCEVLVDGVIVEREIPTSFNFVLFVSLALDNHPIFTLQDLLIAESLGIAKPQGDHLVMRINQFTYQTLQYGQHPPFWLQLKDTYCKFDSRLSTLRDRLI